MFILDITLGAYPLLVLIASSLAQVIFVLAYLCIVVCLFLHPLATIILSWRQIKPFYLAVVARGPFQVTSKSL